MTFSETQHRRPVRLHFEYARRIGRLRSVTHGFRDQSRANAACLKVRSYEEHRDVDSVAALLGGDAPAGDLAVVAQRQAALRNHVPLLRKWRERLRVPGRFGLPLAHCGTLRVGHVSPCKNLAVPGARGLTDPRSVRHTFEIHHEGAQAATLVPA